MTRFFAFIILLLFLCGCSNQEQTGSSSTSLLQTTTTMELGTTLLEATTSMVTTSTTHLGTATSTSTSTSSTLPIELPAKDKPKLSMKFGKGTYHSAEKMEIILRIDSVRELNSTEINLLGIFAGRHFWLNKTGTYDLVNGTNNITFEYTTPLCNQCSGIAAGTYTVEAEVVYQDKTVARDIKSVSLIQ